MADPNKPIRRRASRAGPAADSPGATDPVRDASRPGAVRLQRLLADAGVASRRKCEELIERGVVRVNGRVVDSLPAFATPDDRVDVEGVGVSLKPRRDAKSPRAREGPARARRESTPQSGADLAQRLTYVMLYKPRGVVSTASDPAGRRTVVDLVRHPSAARLFPVGRLDFDTQGLLLLTNDGDLANVLTHPRYGVHKTYRALVKGSLDEAACRQIEEGIFLAERKEGRTVGAARTARVHITIVKRDRDRTVLDITLQEGRNRQVRRMLARVGCPVKRLVRIRMGPIELKGLAIGEWRELTRDELRTLRAAAKGPDAVAQAVAKIEARDHPERLRRPSRPSSPRASRKPPARRSRPASDGRDDTRGGGAPRRRGQASKVRKGSTRRR